MTGLIIITSFIAGVAVTLALCGWYFDDPGDKK